MAHHVSQYMGIIPLSTSVEVSFHLTESTTLCTFELNSQCHDSVPLMAL